MFIHCDIAASEELRRLFLDLDETPTYPADGLDNDTFHATVAEEVYASQENNPLLAQARKHPAYDDKIPLEYYHNRAAFGRRKIFISNLRILTFSPSKTNVF